MSSAKMDAGRAFLDEDGMVETGLSKSSLYQASLVAKGFACRSCCFLNMN